MEAALHAIAEPHRRRIIRLVRNEELTAGEIASHFEVSRPAISQHLRILKTASLVTERRQGTKRFYRAHDENLAALRTFFEVLLGEDTYMSVDPASSPSTVEVAPLEPMITPSTATRSSPVRSDRQRPAIITVAIIDEHQLFAVGLHSCLTGSPFVRVATVPDDDIDVAIVSGRVAQEQHFDCPLVVCGDVPNPLASGNDVAAVLPRRTLTAHQLIASVHAAAAGLRGDPHRRTLIPAVGGPGTRGSQSARGRPEAGPSGGCS